MHGEAHLLWLGSTVPWLNIYFISLLKIWSFLRFRRYGCWLIGLSSVSITSCIAMLVYLKTSPSIPSTRILTCLFGVKGERPAYHPGFLESSNFSSDRGSLLTFGSPSEFFQILFAQHSENLQLLGCSSFRLKYFLSLFMRNTCVLFLHFHQVGLFSLHGPWNLTLSDCLFKGNNTRNFISFLELPIYGFLAIYLHLFLAILEIEPTKFCIFIMLLTLDFLVSWLMITATQIIVRLFKTFTYVMRVLSPARLGSISPPSTSFPNSNDTPFMGNVSNNLINISPFFHLDFILIWHNSTLMLTPLTVTDFPNHISHLQ